MGSYFDGAPWTFQEDSAPSHGLRMTQSWIRDHISSFMSKYECPSRSPDLNLLILRCSLSWKAGHAELPVPN